MKNIKVKKFEESLQFDYPVCEIVNCIKEASNLAMTETKFVDFCEYHYNIYILGEE